METNEKLSPLYGVRIGSMVKLNNQFVLTPVVDAEKITYAVFEENTEAEMTADSHYSYFDSSNQVSLGVSAAGGLLGKFKVSAGAAWGHASVESHESTHIAYQLKTFRGAQVIYFGKLTPELLLNCLVLSTRDAAIAALDAFNKYSMALDTGLEADKKKLAEDRKRLNADRRKLEADRDLVDADKLLTPEALQAAIRAQSTQLLEDRDALEIERDTLEDDKVQLRADKAKFEEEKKKREAEGKAETEAEKKEGERLTAEETRIATFSNRENAINVRDSDLKERRKAIVDREKAIATKEQGIEERQQKIGERQEEINERQKAKGQEEALKLDWIAKVDKFYQDHGEGVVVGIIWGGLGIVHLNLTGAQSGSKTKFDATANVSFASPTAAVSVEAAYGYTGTEKQSDIKVEVHSVISGSCVAEQVRQWQEMLNKKALDEIAKVKMLENIPSLTTVPPLPKIPEFEKPKKDEKLTDKFDKITSLDGLKALSIASAYDKKTKKYKDDYADWEKKGKKGAEPTKPEPIEDFVKNAEQKQQVDKQVQVDSDRNTLIHEETEALQTLLAQDSNSEGLEKVEGDPYSGFTPLGVWISRWSDLFPWLAKGYSNTLDTLGLNSSLTRQCMIQDFVALSKIYRYAENSGVSPSSLGFKSPFSVFAEEFQQAAVSLQNGDTTKTVYNRLFSDAQWIYDKWNQVQILRDAELGLGVFLPFCRYNYRISDYEKELMVDSAHDQSLVMPSNFQENPYVPLDAEFKIESCNFSLEKENYGEFSRFAKVLPLITPYGRICAFGPLNRMFGPQVPHNGSFNFTKTAAGIIYFDLKEETINGKKYRYLEGEITHVQDRKKDKIQLHPIKFKAAEGREWKGQIFSTNLGAMKGLKDGLKELYDELRETQNYTFVGDNWKDRKIDDAYANIKPSYVGLVDQLKTVF